MKVEVTDLGLPVPKIVHIFLRGRNAPLHCSITELRSCAKVEVTDLGLPVPKIVHIFLRGRNAPLHCSITELRSCAKVEVAVLGSLSLTVLMVSVDVKQH